MPYYPAGFGALPAVSGSEALPAGSKARPAGSKALPTAKEALLVCSEALATGSKALPAGLEALPAGFDFLRLSTVSGTSSAASEAFPSLKTLVRPSLPPKYWSLSPTGPLPPYYKTY